MSEKQDISNVADLELGNYDHLSSFQKEMYLTDLHYDSMMKSTEYSGEGDDEVIGTSFWKKIKKTTMFVDISESMPITPGKSGEFIYTVNDKLDLLLYIYMIREFPKYKVKSQLRDLVQICWTHNLGHNSIIRLDLIVDNDSKQTITSTWLDMHGQFFTKKDFRKSYRKMVGDAKYFPEWSNELPPVTVKVPIPFFFSRGRDSALPLFLTKSKVSVRGLFRNKLSELMKMRFRKDVNGDWVEKPFRYDCLEGILSRDEEIKSNPELFAYYSRITPEEKNGWKDLIEESVSKSYKLYYDDITIISPERPYTCREPFIHELLCPTPAKGILWVAQNQEGLKYNNYSNYTTDPLDITVGKNPVDSISMKHGGTTVRFQGMKPTHFDEMMSYYRTISPSFETGYHAIFYSPWPYDTNADVGPIFNDEIKTSLGISIIDESTEKSDNVLGLVEGNLPDSFFEDQDANDINRNLPRYRLIVIILCMKKIEFFWSDKIKVVGGNEKTKY